MTERLTGLEVLEQIRPAADSRRFFQSWDNSTQVLRFGCGDAESAVQIGSDGSVETVSAERPTKLRPATAKKFLSGETENEPLGAVQQILRQYLFFADQRTYLLLAAWITGTYLYSIFSHYGYVFLHSALHRCGKTRVEEITSHLAFQATTPRNAPTPPAMRETAVEGGTAIFDTLERWREKSNESFAAAMELLDAGFRRGGEVSKMVRDADEWKQEVYPVYAPYMFAAIDRKSLSDTALDRSFVIEMVRKNTRLKTRPYDGECEKACEPIRERLYVAAFTNAKKIAETYESQDLQREIELIGLHDRAVDIWKPILAVAQVFGSPEIVEQLYAVAREMSPDPDRQEEMRQLAIVSGLRTVAGEGGTVAGTTQKIASMLKEVTGIDAPDLSALLKGWGFAEKSMRLEGIDTPRKGWELSDADLAPTEEKLR